MRDGANAWPGRLGRALVWGVTLALFAAFFALQDWARWQAAPATILGRIGVFAACHGLGGAVAGALADGLFGRAGAAGWALALLGGVAVTIAGGLLGGAVFGLLGTPGAGAPLVEGAIRVGMGPLTVPLAVAQRPALAAIWLVGIVAARLWRRSGGPV
jgi:hypothetical protein